jgi:hypothetical protein
MDAKRSPLESDVLTCARIAEALHRAGRRDLANSMIEAMYYLLSDNGKIANLSTLSRPRPALELVVNAES